jgi:hypothetical protein
MDFSNWTQEPDHGDKCSCIASFGRFGDRNCQTNKAVAACEEDAENGNIVLSTLFFCYFVLMVFL